MNYGLPESVEVGGEEFAIRTDFRAILDIIEVMNDPELNDEEKGLGVLTIFYPEAERLPNSREALEQCFLFIDGGDGDRDRKPGPRLMDWERDFPRIIAPVNRVLGGDARAVPWDPERPGSGLHWWTFLAAYMEIGGDCVMSEIVHIRDKLARGKKLEKHEREWYRRNRDIVDLPMKFTSDEEELVKAWTT